MNNLLRGVFLYLIITQLSVTTIFSTQAESFLETNNYLKKTEEHTLSLQNKSDSQLSLKIMEEKLSTQSINIAPTDTFFSLWKDTDSYGFPLEYAKVKKIEFHDFSDQQIYYKFYILKEIILNPNEIITINSNDNFHFCYIKPKNNTNIYSTIDAKKEKTELTFQNTPVSLWESILDEYDFLKITNEFDPKNGESCYYSSFFKERILPSFNISVCEFYNKLTNYYKDFSLNKNLTNINNIPKIIHTIWLTDFFKPNGPPYLSFELLLNTMKICRPQDGWRYIFWIFPSNKLSLLCDHPLNYLDKAMEQFIEIIDPEEIVQSSLLKDFFNLEIGNKNYGAASDILRYIILDYMGGIYRDVDFEFVQSPGYLTEKIDFFAGMDGPSSAVIGNAMIASKPNHPILKRCIDLISCFYNNQIQTNYIYEIQYNQTYLTLTKTGPYMFAVSFFFGSNQQENIDIIFPFDLFFNENLYKKNSKRKKIGAHYQSNLWIKNKF